MSGEEADLRKVIAEEDKARLERDLMRNLRALSRHYEQRLRVRAELAKWKRYERQRRRLAGEAAIKGV